MTIIRRTTDNYFDASGTAIPLDEVSDTTAIEVRLAVMSLRQVLYEGISGQGYASQFADEYNDLTGINQATSTGMLVNGFYRNPASTFLLLSETTDGSTTFTDSTGTSTITSVGLCEHSTTKAKYGSSSIKFPGATSDYLKILYGSSLDFGSADFTVDFWINFSVIPTGADTWVGLFSGYKGGDVSYQILYRIAGGGGTVNSIEISEDTVATKVNSDSLTIAADEWHHMAIVRDTNTMRFFLDGVAVGTGDVTGKTYNANTNNISIGSAISDGSNSILNGYVEDVRLTKGLALYTSGFDLPTVADPVPTNNYTVESVSETASAQADYARLVFLNKEVDSVTLGTDLIAYASRDGGTTWTAATTYTDEGEYTTGVDIISTDKIDISGQPAGTAMRYKLVKANDKESEISGACLQWS